MTTLDRELSDADGLWWFNHLYLRVTLAVRSAVTTTTFRDPAFLERLDVVFANLYFDAVAAGDADPRGGAVGVATAVRVPAPARHPVDPVRAGRDERAHQPRSSRRDRRDAIWRPTARPDRAGARYARLRRESTICSRPSKRRSRSSSQPASWGSSTPRRRCRRRRGDVEGAGGARRGMDECGGAVGAADVTGSARRVLLAAGPLHGLRRPWTPGAAGQAPAIEDSLSVGAGHESQVDASRASTPVGYALAADGQDGLRNLRGNHADHRRLRFLPADI